MRISPKWADGWEWEDEQGNEHTLTTEHDRHGEPFLNLGAFGYRSAFMRDEAAWLQEKLGLFAATGQLKMPEAARERDMWERPKLENGRFEFIEEFGDMVIVSSDENGRINISCFRPKTNFHRPLLITTEQAAWLGAQLSDYAATGVLRDLPERFSALSDKWDYSPFVTDSSKAAIYIGNQSMFNEVRIDIAKDICDRVNAIIQSKAAPIAAPAPEVVPGMWKCWNSNHVPDKWTIEDDRGNWHGHELTAADAHKIRDAHNAEIAALQRQHKLDLHVRLLDSESLDRKRDALRAVEQAQPPVRESGAVEYNVCFGKRTTDLVVEIDSWLARGWQCQGGITVLTYNNSIMNCIEHWFYQAIVRGGEVG